VVSQRFCGIEAQFIESIFRFRGSQRFRGFLGAGFEFLTERSVFRLALFRTLVRLAGVFLPPPDRFPAMIQASSKSPTSSELP
jgi:hypothetical protein